MSGAAAGASCGERLATPRGAPGDGWTLASQAVYIREYLGRARGDVRFQAASVPT